MNNLIQRLAHLYDLKPELEGERGQIGLVKASGASKSVVNQWLSGAIKSIAIEYALKIEANLGISHVWLMAGIGEVLAAPGKVIIIEGAPTEPMMTLATAKEMTLLDLFRRSTDDGQGDILRAASSASKRPAAKILSH